MAKKAEDVAEKAGAEVVGVYAIDPLNGRKSLVREYRADNPSHNVVERKGQAPFEMDFVKKAEMFAKKESEKVRQVPFSGGKTYTIQHVVEKVK